MLSVALIRSFPWTANWICSTTQMSKEVFPDHFWRVPCMTQELSKSHVTEDYLHLSIIQKGELPPWPGKPLIHQLHPRSLQNHGGDNHVSNTRLSSPLQPALCKQRSSIKLKPFVTGHFHFLSDLTSARNSRRSVISVRLMMEASDCFSCTHRIPKRSFSRTLRPGSSLFFLWLTGLHRINKAGGFYFCP